MKVGTDHRIALCACPNCGDELDGTFCVGDDAPPRPGDVTLCANCGHVMAFGDDLRFRELTAAEQHEIAGDERLIAASCALAAAWAERS